ncbi:MAG: hypothetical protein HYZ28_21720 [Myxococcales bacterium]|nr:hypothetical protein [Myxococcales bacterium]
MKRALISGIAVLVLSACGPGPGGSSGTPLNCRLEGVTVPDAGQPVVDQCPSGSICAQLEDPDAGTTAPICVKQVDCGGLSCPSGKCGDAAETSPSTKRCIK